MKLPREKYLTEDEYRRLLRVARGRHHRNAKRDLALLAVAGLTGVRVGELVTIEVGGIHLDETLPYVQIARLKKRRPVTHEVSLTPTARLAILRYLRTLSPEARATPTDRLFPISKHEAQMLFKSYARLAGLNPHYSIHALRHYRGLTLYEATRDLNLVKEALGHSSIRSTEVYLHTVDASEKTARVDTELDLSEDEAASDEEE